MSGPIRTTTATLNNTTGTQDITIPGAFGGNPKGVMVIYGGTDDGSNNIHGQIGVGFADGTNEFCAFISSENGITTSDTYKAVYNDAIMKMTFGTGSTRDTIVVFDSFITDGVRIDITNSRNSGDATVTFVLFGGSDVSDVSAGYIDLDTGTIAITETIGHSSDLIFTSSSGLSYFGITSFALFSTGVYVNDGSDSQKSQFVYDEDAVTTTSVQSQYLDAEVSSQGSSWNATINNITSTGFDITPSASAGGAYLIYLSVNLSSNVNFSLSEVDSPTATGDLLLSGLNYVPSFSMMLLSALTAPGLRTDDGSMAVSVFDSSSESCVAYSSQDAVTTTSTTSRYTSQAVADLTAGTTDLHNGTFSSFNSDGFTLNFPTDVAGTARKWAVLTVGANPPSDDFTGFDASYMLMGLM